MYKVLATVFFLGLTVPGPLSQPASTVNEGCNLSWVTFLPSLDVMPSHIQCNIYRELSGKKQRESLA